MTPSPLPTAVVLGGTSAHRVLVTALKARGYRVVLVDYLEHPPAAQAADLHVRASTLDVAAVTEVARAQAAALVIATSVDQANVVAAQVSEMLGLPHPYSGATAAQIADKTTAKARMVALGLPTARHITVTDTDALETARADAGLAFPLIVKPADSNGSKGVVRCDSAPALAEGLTRALAYSRTRQAIVEDFVEGVEYNIYAVIRAGRPQIITACRKYNHDSADGTAITSYATWYQDRLPARMQAAVQDTLERIAAGFGLHNTALILQVLVADERISVLEFAPRVGGGLSYWAVLAQTGCDLVAVMLEAWLGEAPRIPPRTDSDIVITTHLYARPCTFDRIEGVEALRADGTIEDYIPNKTRGGVISAEKASRDRVGSFVLRGASPAEILAKVAHLMAGIEAYDVEGHPVTDKETYIRAV